MEVILESTPGRLVEKLFLDRVSSSRHFSLDRLVSLIILMYFFINQLHNQSLHHLAIIYYCLIKESTGNYS